LNASGFIYKLLEIEVIFKEDPTTEEDYAGTLLNLVQRGILELHGDVHSEKCYISVPSKSRNVVDFNCSLLWPFIECYWISCLLLFQVKPDGVPYNSIAERCQWLADNLYKQGKCYSAATISKESIQNALLFFKLYKVIEVNSGKVYISETYKNNDTFAALVITINRLRKNRKLRTNGDEEVGDIGAILAKFPILSKL